MRTLSALDALAGRGRRRRPAVMIAASAVSAASIVSAAMTAPAGAVTRAAPQASAPIRLAAPAATAAGAVSPDQITVTAAGTPAYRLDGEVTSGGIAVTDTVADYATDRIRGRGGVPGSAGGTATVEFDIGRVAPAGLSGTFTLDDPAAGVRISAYVTGGVTVPSDGIVTWQGTGTVRRGDTSGLETVSFTVRDRHPDPGDHAIRIVHAGQDRRAILRLPDDYDGSRRPVLFHFPGLLEAPYMAEFFGRMADFAQSRGFIMVTPEHYGIGWQGVPGGPASPDVDDPGFVRVLQDILVERFNADPHRLYASGMSNGGFFTSKTACENDRFAAFVPVAGQLQDLRGCRPGRPVPITLIHGDADPIVAYDEAPRAAEFWARNNGCSTTATVTALPDKDPGDNTTVVRHDYRDCPAGAPVVLYQIKGGGHNWPGGTPFLGPLLGGTTKDIDGNAVIWDFVSRFSR